MQREWFAALSLNSCERVLLKLRLLFVSVAPLQQRAKYLDEELFFHQIGKNHLLNLGTLPQLQG